jgi:hypothetical protein
MSEKASFVEGWWPFKIGVDVGEGGAVGPRLGVPFGSAPCDRQLSAGSNMVISDLDIVPFNVWVHAICDVSASQMAAFLFLGRSAYLRLSARYSITRNNCA